MQSFEGIWYNLPPFEGGMDNWGATIKIDGGRCWGYYADGRETWHGTCDFSNPNELKISMVNGGEPVRASLEGLDVFALGT